MFKQNIINAKTKQYSIIDNIFYLMDIIDGYA